MHGWAQDQGVSNVNMATGAVTAAGRKPLHLAHGAINFVAWGIMLPLGVLLARFTKHIPVKAVRACVHRLLCVAAAWQLNALSLLPTRDRGALPGTGCVLC